MGISKAQCRQQALETFLRIAKSDTQEAISAAYALMNYANPQWLGYGAVPPPPEPAVVEASGDERADESGGV